MIHKNVLTTIFLYKLKVGSGSKLLIRIRFRQQKCPVCHYTVLTTVSTGRVFFSVFYFLRQNNGITIPPVPYSPNNLEGRQGSRQSAILLDCVIYRYIKRTNLFLQMFFFFFLSLVFCVILLNRLYNTLLAMIKKPVLERGVRDIWHPTRWLHDRCGR